MAESTPHEGSAWRARFRLLRFLCALSWHALRYEVVRWFTAAKNRPMHVHRTRLRIAESLLHSLGVKRTVHGPRPAYPHDSTCGRLLVANHRCGVDIGVLLAESGGIFLSRADLGQWPIVGRLSKQADTIFVDRDSKHSGAAAIRELRRRLKAGQTVIVFPEGTTHRGDDVQTFRAGAFAAARGLDVEVVPVGLAYPPGVEYIDMSFMTHVKIVAARKRTPVAVEFGEPLPTGLKTAQLAEACQTRVQALVSLARQRLESDAST